MRLIFIRHGDPNYRDDCLTERGREEAKALQERLRKIDPDYVYVSPLGRAKETCEIAMEGIPQEKITYDWLQEFTHMIQRKGEPYMYCWDWVPAEWTEEKDFFDPERWYKHPAMESGNIEAYYKEVVTAFRELLKKHGYERKGRYYEVKKGNHDTLVFFCHFGVQCVLLSDLLNISPMVLWHGTAMAPTSVTEIYTEERRKGAASFRITYLGDQSHLYKEEIEPSFSARFCECYEDDTRHD